MTEMSVEYINGHDDCNHHDRFDDFADCDASGVRNGCGVRGVFKGLGDCDVHDGLDNWMSVMFMMVLPSVMFTMALMLMIPVVSVVFLRALVTWWRQ
jgi:hypothetical protein